MLHFLLRALYLVKSRPTPVTVPPPIQRRPRFKVGQRVRIRERSQEVVFAGCGASPPGCPRPWHYGKVIGVQSREGQDDVIVVQLVGCQGQPVGMAVHMNEDTEIERVYHRFSEN